MSREVEEIKAKIDIAEFLGEYLKLIPAGANFKALCPFHNEKTPSLMVNGAKQIWRCFGCGEGGDVFSFLMKMEGLDFPGALKILAQRAGVPLSGRSFENSGPKTRLYDLCRLASKYWQKILWESSSAEPVREYLKNRGLSEETAEDFHLGYAIDSWDNLLKFLVGRGFREEEIFQAGLAVRKNQGSGFYDRFRGRLMFPILDVHGQTVGFGGRTLNQEESAKYINTPQSDIYNKSAVLYGLYQAKEVIKKADVCVLVEGYMDVLPSHQAGVKNVAAISGTALTLEQIKILKRYSVNLALALDMDEAGQRAAERSIDLGLENELNIRVITLKSGKDPGEAATNSPADWLQAIKEAEPVMEYFWQRALKNRDAQKPEDKKYIGKFMLEKIIKLGDKIEQDYWLKELAKRLSISESVLREVIDKNMRAKKYVVVSPSPISSKTPDSRDLLLFKKIMALVLAFPGHLPEVVEKFPLDFLADSEARELYKNLVLFYNKNINSFASHAVDNSTLDLFDLASHWLQENNSTTHTFDLLNESFLLSQNDFVRLEAREAKSELQTLLTIIKIDDLEKRISQLQAALAQAEKEPAQENLERIYVELNELMKEKDSLKI